MKSAYAPLPFSYLSPDANPKVGLRKDGVYGTSADVPRVYQPETQDYQPQHEAAGDISMSTEYPYSVYANANVLNPGTETDYHRGNPQQQPMQPRAFADRGLYSQDGPQRIQETALNRPQKPEGGFLVYPPSKQDVPYGGRIQPNEVETERKDEPSSDHKYRGIAVANRPHVEHRPNAVDRVPSHYPPVASADKQVYDTADYAEASSIYAGGPQQKKPPAMMSKDFDNFILVKDPNLPESIAGSQPISVNNDRGKNNLQTLFEADEPRKLLPRYNIQPPMNHTDSGPSNAPSDYNTSHKQETVYDTAIYAPYREPKQTGAESATVSEVPIYSNGRQDAVHPDSNRNSDDRLVKDSEGNRTRGCECGKCTAVIIAVIFTAIICLGAGFIAGWFGAKAAGNGAGSSPSETVLTNLSTVTVGGGAPTKTFPILTTKVSAISTTSVHLTTKANAKTTQGNAPSTTVTARSGQ